MNQIKAPKHDIRSGSIFNNYFILCSLGFTSLICVFSCLCFDGLAASPCLSINKFLYNSLPTIWFSSINPKCLLMIMGNLIVVILVGQSKLHAPSESPAANFYNKYVERGHGLKRLSSIEEILLKKRNWVEKKIVIVEEAEKEEKEKEEEIEAEKSNCGEGEKGVGRDEVEELNRRVEEFIARVNKQRWLEANQVLVPACA